MISLHGYRLMSGIGIIVEHNDYGVFKFDLET